MLKIWVAPEPLKELNYGFFQKPDSMKATFRNERLINIKLNVSCFLVSVFVPCCALWVEEIRSLSHQRHLTWGKPSALVSDGASFVGHSTASWKIYRNFIAHVTVKFMNLHDVFWPGILVRKMLNWGREFGYEFFISAFDSRSMPVSLQKSINYDSILNETFREYFFLLFRSLLTC